MTTNDACDRFGHLWFDLGYDHQCGQCGVFFKLERDRIAIGARRIGLVEIAELIAQAAPARRGT